MRIMIHKKYPDAGLNLGKSSADFISDSALPRASSCRAIQVVGSIVASSRCPNRVQVLQSGNRNRVTGTISIAAGIAVVVRKSSFAVQRMIQVSIDQPSMEAT